MSPHYPHYYPPSHAILPPYVPISPPVIPHSPPAPKPRSPFSSSNLNLSASDSVKEPLELLRGLADKYKNLTGLAEPLNLSLKASSKESNKNPVSSFSPPTSKFLNEPSPLYTPQPVQVERNAHEAQDGDAGVEVAPYSHPEEVKDAYIVDVKPALSSPTYNHIPTLRTEQGTTARAQTPSSPKTVLPSVWPKEERDGDSDVKRVDLSHILPSLSRDNGGKMEIEIPLSVLHKWLRMCQVEPSSTMRGPMQLTALPNKEEQAGQGRLSETSPTTTGPSPRGPQDQSPAAEDLRLRRHSVPSPPHTSATRHNSSPNHFTGYKSLPSGPIVKNAFGHCVYSAERQSYPKPPSYWGTYDTVTQAPKTSPGPVPVHQDYLVSKGYRDDSAKSARERSEVGPSTVLMVDSIPGSVLHLTTEEMMKLKKIISSS